MMPGQQRLCARDFELYETTIAGGYFLHTPNPCPASESSCC